MATVVITFFLFARIDVCKMDADYQERPRDRTTSRREKRWSMNSQRLEEIVAELMKPISDIRRSFDTDLSALLEEYLTEAGLHALEASEEGSGAPSAAPNYAELALLLQHSASLYGRKVDFLYQHVLSVSDSLHNNTHEETGHEAGEAGPVQEVRRGEGGESEASPRRRRRVSAAGGFSRLELEASGAARREAAPPRPPPTLPRMYIELEPRVLAEGDAPLRDYAGEPVGLPADFHVTWRLQDGFLVDELEGPRSSTESVLNPISLVELQAAISAAAPPSPPPLQPRERSLSPDPPDGPHGEPLHASTPLPDRTLALKKERKRRSDIKVDEIVGRGIKILISKELRRKLRHVQEFSISSRWISRVVERRKSRILAERRRGRAHAPSPLTAEFYGFDHSDMDIGGFIGWSETEAALAKARAAREPDSDDDGFFEQSSLGDSDHSRVEDLSVSATSTTSTTSASSASSSNVSGCEWPSTAVGGGLEVHAVARSVLAACPSTGAASFASVLGATARHQSDVSHVLLATLFLANAGNVEIVQGAPLTTNTFSLRLLSTDERLYCAAARDHFQR